MFANIKPGEIVVLRGKLRVVVWCGRRVIGFRKVRRSWTDPNPTAWYDNTPRALRGMRRTGVKTVLRRAEIRQVEEILRAAA